MTGQQTIELLAPAGGMDSVVAAVRCGANAVYLGGKTLNARRNAENFDSAALREAADYCHERGARLYLTLNTLVFDRELGELLRALEEACAAGVDALIVQDLAMAEIASRCAPGLRLHASTQMTVHNLEGAKMLEGLGFSRVVLAREMAEEEICHVARNTSLEVECFVHGAQCMCVSGQCTLSAMIGGRSGNRGMCAQPCRLPFGAGDETHTLSLRDLSLVEEIPRLREAGVASLKIEGRMKRPEYVAGAVAACRGMLDGTAVDMEALEAVFSRSGFTDGYFTGKLGKEMFGTRQKEDVTAAHTAVLKKLQNLYHKETQRVPVSFRLEAKRGEPVKLSVADGSGNSATVQGDAPVEAVHSPTTTERAEGMLGKTGGTPYYADSIKCVIDEGLLLPSSVLNGLRREALERLSGARVNSRKVAFQKVDTIINITNSRNVEKQRLRVRLHSHRQWSRQLAVEAEQVSLPVGELLKLPPEALEAFSQNLVAELPRIYFGDGGKVREELEKAKALGIRKALVGNLGSLYLAKEAGFQPYGDFGLNITNSVALEKCRELGLEDVTLSFELERGQLQSLGGELPRGILAYGYLPLMATRNCPVKISVGGCGNCGGFQTLTDRKGNKFPVACQYGISNLYNCVPLYLGDRMREFSQMDFLTLYFTRETPEECANVLRLYKEGGSWDGDKTRGLYYRGVL